MTPCPFVPFVSDKADELRTPLFTPRLVGSQ